LYHDTVKFVISPIPVLETKRLIIRQLSCLDKIDNYHSWMRSKSNLFIESVNSNVSKEDLYKYIDEKNSSDTALLFGIFDKETKKHIGNGKFEPINFLQKFTVLGLFIGDVEFRGKGLAKEFIHCCFKKVLLPMNVDRILLGVDKENVNAISAYSKAGFVKSNLSKLNLAPGSVELELKWKT
jgi:ribosomal-protein-alanine N-acetyltransferase